MSTAAEMEAERVANLTCFFPKSGPAPPLLTTNQILSLAALLTIVAWRYIAIFVRVQKNKKKIANGEEVEDEEYSLIRTDGRKVVWWDCGRGGPIDVWMWILTKLPCLALGLGLALPAFLSYEGLRQSSFTMEVDMDFAGYVKTETQMQLHQDALGTARWCRSKAISSYEDARKQSQQQRRLNSFGFPFVEDFVDEEEYVGSTEATTFEDLEIHQNHTFNSRDLAKKAKRKKGPYWTLDIFYEATGDKKVTNDLGEIEGGSKLGDFGVFSDVRLTEIREFEKELMKFPGYDGHDQTDKIYDQCWRLKSSKNPCELPQSPVNIFFGTYQVNKHGNGTSGAFDGKGPLNNIERVLKDLLKQKILIFTDLEFAENHLTSSFTRSRFRGHGPGAHKFLENIHNKLFSREQDPLLRKYKNIKITWSESSHLKTYEVFSALVHDAWFALGSFAFVATFVLIHLGSFLLAGFAIYGILISFPAAYYFFYVVMGFRKMMILNFVSLFLIMGIGADDVFVMYDAYNQAAAALGVRSSPGQRLRWAYLEAGSAMLVTTITTAGSFFSNCVSEVVVVRQFGFFMGVVVVLNWLHVMVIFPSFLLIYEIWWGRCWRHCCCCLHRFCPEPQYDDDDDIQVTDDGDDEDDIEISADDAVADIERHHAEETAARQAALDEQQQKQHARLQDRLTRRHSGVTPAKKVPKKTTAINASPRATGRMAMMTKSKLAMLALKQSQKSETEEQKVYKEEVKLLSKDKDEGELDLHHLGRVERCFNQKFSPFLYTLRLPLCLSMIGLAVIGVIMVIQNFTPGDAPTIFLEDRNLGRLQRIMEESGLGELSNAQEKQVMSQYPSKSYTRKSCPGLLPDGLTYCNGRGDCPFSRCITEPKSCVATTMTPLEKAMLFVCKCEAQWSGYNCSKPSVPGSLALVRRISHRGVDQFSTTGNSVLAPAPNIQVLIFNKQDTTQEAELINVHDWEVQWKLLGVGKVQNNQLNLLSEKPGWLTIQPEFGTVPAASYLTPDGIPLPGKNKEKIKLTVTGAGKEDDWYNEDNSVMFVMFEDITVNRPAHHLNFTRRSDFTTRYMAELQAWAPATGKLNSFNLEYQTDRTQAGTFEDGTTSTSTSTTKSLKSNTNKIFIKSAKTEWFSKNAAGERERFVDSMSVDVEKMWPDGKKNRRTVSVSTVDIGKNPTLPIEISALPEEDFVAASGDVRAVICNIFVIISSRGYESNTTYTYTLERSDPASPGKLVVKFLQHSFSTSTVTATFVRPNSELEQEANIQSFVPTLRVMDSSTYVIISTNSNYPEQLASDACSGGVQWKDESGDCSIAVAIPPNLRGASYAYELIVKPSNGIQTGDPSESFVKPTVKQVNGHAYKEIYAAVSGGAGDPTPPVIPADAITYTTHKQAIYLEIDMEKIQPGHKSPLSIPKCEARKVGGTTGSSIVKNTIVALGAKLATVLFSNLDDTQAYQIECWCDSTSPGNGKTGTPTIASVLSTVPSFNIEDDKIQFVDFPDYGTAASGQSTTPFVYASLTVTIAGVTAEQEKCCTMVVTCDCDKNGAPGNFLNLLNSNATMSTLTSGTDKDITVNVLKIPRGEVGTPSVCKFKCSAELRLKKALTTTIDMYEVQGGRVATLAKTEKVNLAPPSPPKACDPGWSNKDPTTINTENLGNWPVVYKKNFNKMAALNISDVVIPMQLDDTSGEPTRFSCTLTKVAQPSVKPISTRWVSTDPNDPSAASGTKVLVVFPGAKIDIGEKYTANCYSWIQTSISEPALVISEFTVGSTAPAPVIRTFAVEEQIPRKVGFVVQVKPIFHNPPATKISCTATKDGSSELTEETVITQDLIEMIETGKRCEVGISVGDSNNEKICATKVLREQKCEPGGGKFQFNSNSKACKCCTSGDPSVNAPGTKVYQLPDVVVHIPTTGSAFSADGNNVVLLCKAINSIGDSTLSTTKTLTASLPPKKPTSVTVNSVTTSSVEIAVVSVTSESDRGGKTLTKKTCRACGLFPTWCPTGVIGTGEASGCCWSTSEVEVNDMSTSAAVTINSKLTNGMEYLIECRSHHDHGISPFARISPPDVVYVGALPSDSVVFDNSALSFEASTQKATLNVNIASYIIDDKHEGTDILGVKCESVSGAVTAVKCMSPAVKSADKSDCVVPASAPTPSIELSGGIYTNTDADPWCDLNTDLSVAPAGKNWAGLGTCGYGSKILDKDEYCFPTCTLPKEPYGSVLCQSNVDGTATTVIDFECKTPAERNSLPNTGSACNIKIAKNQVQNLAKPFQGNCANANDNLPKEEGCTPECKAGFKAEGQMYCNKNGVLTNNFRCMLANTLTMEDVDGLDLATGTTYEFKCKIKNRLGWSTASSATSNSVTPQSKPSPPTITSVFNGVDKQLTVSYSPTSDDAANFPYKCQANVGKGSSNGVDRTSTDGTAITLTGLVNDESYWVSCTAENSQGESDRNEFSKSVLVGISPSNNLVSFTSDDSAKLLDGDNPTSGYIEVKLTVNAGGVEPAVNKILCRACLQNTQTCSDSVTQESSFPAQLKITGLIAGSTYRVECQVESPLGVNSLHSTLTPPGWQEVLPSEMVVTKPNSPTNVVAVIHSTDERKVQVTFTAPELDGNNAIVGYRCGLMPMNTHFNNWVAVGNTARAVTLVELTAGLQITVGCSAENAKGWSTPGQTGFVEPISLPPTMIPGKVETIADKSKAGITGQLQIFAAFPVGDNSGGQNIDCYQCQGSDSSGTSIEMAAVTSQCDVSNGIAETMPSDGIIVAALTLGEKYSFKCRARNALGWGSWSNSSDTATAANVPPAPEVLSIIPSFEQISLKLVSSTAETLRAATGYDQITDRECKIYYNKQEPVPEERIVDVPVLQEGSGIIHVYNLQNKELVSLKCKQENAAGWGPWSADFSDTVVPGQAVTSVIEPTESMTTLPLKSAVRSRLAILIEVSENNVAIESMSLEEIKFRVTVESSLTTGIKEMIETNIQTSTDLIELLQVTKIKDVIAAIESDTYNSADLAVVRVFSKGGANLLHTFENSVEKNPMNKTMLEFVVPSNSAENLELEIRIYPVGGQNLLSLSSNGSYLLSEEEQSETAFITGKICGDDNIAVNQACSDAYDATGKRDAYENEKYYYLGNIFIRRTSPEYEQITVVVTAENNILKKEYNIRLKYLPEDCSHCNQTLTYRDPTDNQTMVVVEPGGECSLLTGECMCDPGYQGVGCNSYCPNNCGDDGDDSSKGSSEHGVCSDGRCVCDSGWGGAACDRMQCPVCLNGGNCTGTSSMCTCPPAWKGTACDKPVCMCGKSGHGKCEQNSQKCKCIESWSGPDCEDFLKFKFEETIKLSFAWGFAEQNKGVIVDSKGKIPVRPLLSSESAIDLSAAASQLHFLDFCRMARQEVKLQTRPELLCWVESFAENLGVDLSANITASGSVGFPVSREKFAGSVSTFMDGSNKKGGKFNTDIDLDPRNPTKSQIRWVSVHMRVDVSQDSDAKILQPVWKKWKQFVDNMNARPGSTTTGPAVMISSQFTKMDQQLALIGSTVNGFMTSNLICLAAVLLFTGDIVISIYTMMAIVLIVVTLLGFLFGILGWTFGAIEAVGVTIFVGMSVDYCLHTAHGYAHSASNTRKGKVTDALTHIGVSILGAFVTTAGSTLFLFPTWIYLFYQLGVMMFANTVLAVLFSFFFLSTILMTCGPTHGCGQITSILSCKCIRTIGQTDENGKGEGDEEDSDDDWDPDSLVGQIEAEQRREEREKKVRLEHQRMEEHARLQRRLENRKKNAKKKTKKTAVLPVAVTEEEDENKEDGEEDENVI